MQLEILYLAWNRLEFTKMSFHTLLFNTDWRRVSRLVVYDDGSEDPTAEYLKEAGKRVPVPAFEFRQVNFNAPGATMNDYLALTEADLFVKLDNDICVPKKWLPAVLGVAYQYPEYDLIGMEAGHTSAPPRHHRVAYGLKPVRHIGGVGLMRVETFRTRMPVPASLGRTSRSFNRDGFTLWQYRHNPKAAWITPDLAVIQLDKIPEEPWLSLSKEYQRRGWQRRWPLYDEAGRAWWSWLPSQAEVAA
jgi:hypothetical protein